LAAEVADELLGRLLDTIHGYLALGNEVIDGPQVCFVRNTEVPDVYDANHVRYVRARTPKEIGAVLERADEVLAASRHRQFLIDPETPPSFEARLAMEGYECNFEMAMVLEGELTAHPTPRGVSIRPVQSEADWVALEKLFRANHEEEGRRSDRDALSPEVTRQVVVACKARKAATFYVASIRGTDCGYFSSWPGTNGMAKVEDLFTLADFRHRGIATALIHHCVEDARARGAREVQISARVDDTPKEMYAALGFRPLAVLRSYLVS